MAVGKYTRVDGKKSSSYCSTVSIVAFVALCLIGVWMLTSSSVNPAPSMDLPAEKQNTQVKDPKEDSENNAKQFEDTPGDIPEDATKGDAIEKPSEEKQEENVEEKQTEEQQEEKVDEKPSEEQQEEKVEEKPSEEQQEEKVEETPSEDKLGEKVEEKPSEEKQEEKKEEDSSEEKTPDSDSKKEDGSDDTKTDGDGSDSEDQKAPEESSQEANPESTENEEPTEESSGEKKEDNIKEKVDENQTKDSDDTSGDKEDGKPTDQGSKEVFPSGAQSEILKETTTQSGSFSTQATESMNEKEAQKSSEPEKVSYSWQLCNTTAGPDFIPCLDNLDAIRHLRSTKHYEHRERHCPAEPPSCLVPIPDGYRRPIEWPKSRDKIWFNNVPHVKLAAIKGHQNWVKVSGDYLIFPGGGTQFKKGALHYIEFIESILSDQGVQFKWGKSPRVVLDVGCGVASFGGYLFDKDVITMSLAPKDEHEAQVQFALERGIPAISAVMGTTRLPFPGIVFDVVHCARCRVPWHIEGGKLLLELNRLLRPGGFFVWSATPVYQKLDEDVQIWNAMSQLTKSMCWELIVKKNDKVNGVGVAVFRKPSTNECYEKRSQGEPPICSQSDDRNAAWNVTLQSCLHKVPVGDSERGSNWPEQWPARVEKVPYWLTSSAVGVYGKPAPEDFTADYEHWKRIVSQSYLSGLGINWSSVRNVMDMRAIYGGFAAALREMNIWVMNVVSVDSADTLPVIYERGLFGIYHDWCESFSTYPRSYDLLHADHLFSKIKQKCNFPALVAEADRILRPEGKIIIRDNVETITELEGMFRAMQWEIRMTYSKDSEGLLFAQKTMWRPKEAVTLPYAM